ncbi:unnamed protein product [Parajaminaea phylloscopi]
MCSWQVDDASVGSHSILPVSTWPSLGSRASICRAKTPGPVSSISAWRRPAFRPIMTASKRTMAPLSPPPQKRSKVESDVEAAADSQLDDEALIAATKEAEADSSSVPGSSTAKRAETQARSAAAAAANASAPKMSKTAPQSSGNPALTTPSDPLALERETMDPAWFAALEDEMSQPYFRQLKEFLASELASGQTFYPPLPLIHSWSRLTPLDTVKVVILGQDPYHGPGQAQGMSFSVPKGVPVPGSLRNIYKELTDEYSSGSAQKFVAPKHGNLEEWAKQGVLLLNASLTVRKSQAGSHHGKGWERFTKAILKMVADRANSGGSVRATKTSSTSTTTSGTPKVMSTKAAAQGSKLMSMFQKQEQKQKQKQDGQEAASSSSSSSQEESRASAEDGAKSESTAPNASGDGPAKSTPGQESGVVFLAWGQPAARTLADAGVRASSKNILLLQSPHPSPLSAHRGFLGNGHFKRANEWLEQADRYGSGGGIKWDQL